MEITNNMEQIELIFATGICTNNNAITGNYSNDDLHINITSRPELIHILIDEPFSFYTVVRCLHLIREQLYTFEELFMNDYIMKYENHLNDCSFGGLKDETPNECIIKIQYYLEYSIYCLD